jgi:competence protein ComEC
MIGKIYPNQLILYHNLDTFAKKDDRTVQDYLVENHISHLKEDSLRNLYQFKNKTLFVVDSLGIYNLKKLRPDVILLRNSPKVNLTRLIDSISPNLIIADGSNYRTYTNRWKTTCKKENVSFHYTGNQGAYVFND